MKTFENSKIPRVFELMQEKGIKGAQITRDLGVSSGNISDWKSGKASPSSAVLVALANYLDTTVEYLTGESDEKEKTPEPLDPDHNVLIMRGRDGSYIRKQLTDEEVRALTVLVSQMKDAPDDI